MRLKSIQRKIAFWAGSCLVIALSFFIAWSVWSARSEALENAEKQAASTARIEAAKVSSVLEQTLNVTRTMTQTMVSLKQSGSVPSVSREGVNDMIKQVLSQNPHFIAFYSDWEPNAFDGRDSAYIGKPGYNSDGRFNFTWSYDEKGQIKSDVTPLGDEEVADWYQVPKNARKESIIEPYPYIVQGKEILETTLVTPILIQDKFYGVIGADIKIDFLQKLADEVNLYNGAGKLFLLSNKGIIVGATGRSDLVNKPLKNAFPELSGDLALINTGQQKVEFTDDSLKVLLPLPVGKTGTPWAVLVMIPKATITGEITGMIWKQVAVSLVLIVFVLGVLWVLAGRIAAPVIAAAQFAENIATGQSVEKIGISSADETGRLLSAMNMMLESKDSLVQSDEKRHEIQESLISLLDDVSRVAEGDLTREISATDDTTSTLADAFNYLIAELRRIIGQVQQVTIQVNQTAMQTQAMTSNLMDEADSQSRQIQTTTQDVAAMSNAAQEVVRTAMISAQVAQQSVNNAQQGAVAVRQTQQGMDRIREQMDEMKNKLTKLNETSEEVKDAVKAVTELANRTGILALNASIQAARAGQAGQGFGVVAKEVAKLAESSAEAAGRIGELVRQMQTSATEATIAIDLGNREVADGTDLAKRASSALDEIQQVSARLAQMTEQITSISRSQALKSETVTRAMSDINAITQRTTKSVEESASNVHGLTALANELKDSVSSFKLPEANRTGSSQYKARQASV